MILLILRASGFKTIELSSRLLLLSSLASMRLSILGLLIIWSNELLLTSLKGVLLVIVGIEWFIYVLSREGVFSLGYDFGRRDVELRNREIEEGSTDDGSGIWI